MTKKRPTKKTIAPTTPEQGSILMISAAIPIFDPHDGHGADWALMAESFFAAGFSIIQNRVDESDRRKLAEKIHQQTYDNFLSSQPEGLEIDAMPEMIEPPEPDDPHPAAVLAPKHAPK